MRVWRLGRQHTESGEVGHPETPLDTMGGLPAEVAA